MPRITLVMPCDCLDPDGLPHHFKAGEQDVPAWVLGNRIAYEHTAEGVLHRHKTHPTRTEAEAVAVFEAAARRRDLR